MCLESNREFVVRHYLKEPLSSGELRDLISRLSGPLSGIVRVKDPKFKLIDTSQLDLKEIESVVDFLSLHGHLMERPVLDDGTTVIIGRPVDDLKKLL